MIAQAMVTLTILEVSGLLRGSSSASPLVATCDAVAVRVSVGSMKTEVVADMAIGAIADRPSGAGGAFLTSPKSMNALATLSGSFSGKTPTSGEEVRDLRKGLAGHSLAEENYP